MMTLDDTLGAIVAALKESDVRPADWPGMLGIALAVVSWQAIEAANTHGRAEEAGQAIQAILENVTSIVAAWHAGGNVDLELKLRFGDLPRH